MYETFHQSFLDKTYEPPSLPLDYPVPSKEGLLFYIQRNANINTVVYEINTNECGQILLDEPMKVYWIKYNKYQEESELNYIQNKLAYGYKPKVINQDLIEFEFVCYPKIFYIHKLAPNNIRVVTHINGVYSYLNNIYVYAEEFGVFPDVQFIEFYGTTVEENKVCYEKIII
jgi:Domain of unknown function (DUF4833)